jgi:DNA anti-recombination protein RmuC
MTNSSVLLANLESVGDRLTQAQTSYREAMDKLAKGKGNPVRQAERVKELGAKTGKNHSSRAPRFGGGSQFPIGVGTYTTEMVA